MSKIINITEQLNFEENPKIQIKDVIVEVNSDATTMLKIMEILGTGENPTPKSMIDMYSLLFNEKDRKKLDDLNLNMNDLTVVIKSAMELVIGESEGE